MRRRSDARHRRLKGLGIGSGRELFSGFMPVIRTVHPPAGPRRQTGLEPGRVVGYGAAVLAVGVALGVRLALDRFVGEEFQPYATTYVAVAFIAWWAGLG